MGASNEKGTYIYLIGHLVPLLLLIATTTGIRLCLCRKKKKGTIQTSETYYGNKVRPSARPPKKAKDYDTLANVSSIVTETAESEKVPRKPKKDTAPTQKEKPSRQTASETTSKDGDNQRIGKHKASDKKLLIQSQKVRKKPKSTKKTRKQDIVAEKKTPEKKKKTQKRRKTDQRRIKGEKSEKESESPSTSQSDLSGKKLFQKVLERKKPMTRKEKTINQSRKPSMKLGTTRPSRKPSKKSGTSRGPKIKRTKKSRVKKRRKKPEEAETLTTQISQAELDNPKAASVFQGAEFPDSARVESLLDEGWFGPKLSNLDTRPPVIHYDQPKAKFY